MSRQGSFRRKLEAQYKEARKRSMTALKAFLRNGRDPEIREEWQRARAHEKALQKSLILFLQEVNGCSYLVALRSLGPQEMDLSTYHRLFKVIPPPQEPEWKIESPPLDPFQDPYLS